MKPYPYMLPSDKQFSDMLKAYNIKKASMVVVYCSGSQFWAARVYWMFKVYGFSDVFILNGGLQKWCADGRPTESVLHPGDEEDYAVTLNTDILRTFEQIVALEAEERHPDLQLIDSRGQPTYDAGHIPNSRNLPFSLFVNGDSTVKDPA